MHGGRPAHIQFLRTLESENPSAHRGQMNSFSIGHRPRHITQGQYCGGDPARFVADRHFTFVAGAIAIWSYRETLD
jgi:hypothetical protein